MVTMVPDWLQGTWKRTYIRRRLPNIPPYNHDHNTTTDKQGTFPPSETIEVDHLNNPDSTIQVRYIQTPYAFMDIRTKAKVNHVGAATTTSQEEPMAFAGVTTVFHNDENNDNNNIMTPLVKWHSCLDLEECQTQTNHNLNEYKERWVDAELNTPRFTNDLGYFQKMNVGMSEDEDKHKHEHEDKDDEHVYLEYDPDRTLLEQWVKVDDGNHKFLAVRSVCGNVLLVVAGKYFGYAHVIKDNNDNGKNDAIFISGIVSDCDYYNGSKWMIDTSICGSSSASVTTRGDFYNLEEGKVLKIPRQEYKLMDGSSLPFSIIECLFEE